MIGTTFDYVLGYTIFFVGAVLLGYAIYDIISFDYRTKKVKKNDVQDMQTTLK